MISHRLDRRIALLRGKREASFDPDQHYLEKAVRSRVMRQVRVHLRRMQPVTVVTPRWSQARRFLDDLSGDLLLGEPSVVARPLSLLPLDGRTPHQAWAWLVQAITEFCHLTLDGPAWQVVSRRGFRHVMADLFARAENGERRCLMIHGIEYIHVEALRDLISVFTEHVGNHQGERRFNLLLCSGVDAEHFAFPGFRRVVLPDYGHEEAIEALVEHLGPKERGFLEGLIDLVGGVPAFVDVLGSQPNRLAEAVADPAAIWRILGSTALDLRHAVEIACADPDLSARLEYLAAQGPRPTSDADQRLASTGLVHCDPVGKTTTLRSPLVAQLVSDD
jgi:hypothetical protein